MPTYSFQCDRCHATVERVLPVGSNDVPVCQSCTHPMRKVIRPPMIHFRGSGFYKTDSTKQSAPKKPAASVTPPAAAESPTTPAPGKVPPASTSSSTPQKS